MLPPSRSTTGRPWRWCRPTMPSCSPKARRSAQPAATSFSPAATTIRRRSIRSAAWAFKDPAAVSATIRKWHYGGYAATRAAAARAHLTELLPALLTTISKAGNADLSFQRFDDFLSRLPSGVAAVCVAAQPCRSARAAGAVHGLGAAHGQRRDPPRPCDGCADRSGLRRQPHAAARRSSPRSMASLRTHATTRR